jgi:putative flavoprotein involved in K+ transport
MQEHEAPFALLTQPKTGFEHTNERSIPAHAAALEVIVIGAGQAGLSAGYHLKRQGVPFLILDAEERVGDQWRKRWDSLRLFTPAWLDSLDGLPFPARAQHFPTKDEMADYLEDYVRHHGLPVRNGVRVTSVQREAGAYRVKTSCGDYRANQVIVALSNYQRRRIPTFAQELAPGIHQIHSSDYKNPKDLVAGPVLIVGAGNSGAEIGIELARAGHRVLLSGRDTGYVPFRMDGFWGRLILVRLVLRVFFHRILTIRTPMGRKARPRMLGKGAPLIRQKPEDLEGAGITRVPRLAGVENGRPRLEDGRVLEVTNVLWSTGFESGLDFIELPIFDAEREPRHDGGVVLEEPGFYFVGQHFQYSFSSTMIHGVGRDAARIASIAAGAARSRESGACRAASA